MFEESCDLAAGARAIHQNAQLLAVSEARVQFWLGELGIEVGDRMVLLIVNLGYSKPVRDFQRRAGSA